MDANDDLEYDLLLLLSDPAVTSDEEQRNYDNLTSSFLPGEVPGAVEVIPRRPDHDVSD